MRAVVDALRPVGIAAAGVVVIRAVAGVQSAVPGGGAVYDGVVWLLSLAVTVGSVPAAVGAAALWLLYAGVFYRLFPQLVPTAAGSLGTDRRLRLVFAGCTVGIAALAFAPGLADRIDPLTVQYRLGGLMAVAAVGLGGVLVGRQDDSTSGETPLTGWLQTATTGDVTAEAPSRFVRLGHTGALTGLLVGASFVLGALTAILSQLSPLPEVLLATAAVYALVPGGGRLGGDLEADLQEAVRAVVWSHKGPFAAMMVVFGVWGSVVVIRVGTLAASDPRAGVVAVQALGDGALGTGTRLFAATAAGWVLLAAGLTYLWYWQRVARRLPAFACAWTDGPAVRPATTRPPHSVAVPTALLAIAVAADGPPTAGVTVQTIAGVLVFPGLLAAGYWILWTLRQPPQPALTDRFVPQIALGGTLVAPAVAVPGIGRAWPVTAWLVLTALSFFPRSHVGGVMEPAGSNMPSRRTWLPLACSRRFS